MRLVSLAATVSLVTIAAGQACPRPIPPPTGHATAVDLFVPVTYSDGYQTFASMIRPAGAAPSCGWPLVVHVHPMGQQRGYDLALQMMIAGQGYAVWSYDVRGHGQAAAANVSHPQAGSTLWGPRERMDLAEQLQFVAADPQWTGIVDATRIAVMGSSQGGAHAWTAAAFAGQTINVPGRPSIVFPPIACAIATDFVADAVNDWLRGGHLFSNWFVEAISGSYTGIPFDPAFLQACRSAFLAQDAAPLLATFVAEGRPLGALLAASNVPVLYSHAYHDIVDSPLGGIAQLEGMATAHRALLGPIGHGVVGNDHELEFRHALMLRWLHRWLWNEANEVELEPAFLLPELPLRQQDRDDLQHLWSRAHRESVATPPTAARWWLSDAGSLQEVAPSAPQVDASVQQTIDPLATTFTPNDYLTVPAARDIANVLLACPLDERVYVGLTSADSQLAASASVHLAVVPQSTEWMLAVLLTVQPPEVGASEVTLASQAISSAASVPGIGETYDVRLSPVAVRLPAGTTVRLRLRNLWLRESPQPQNLEVAPLFHDFRVDIVHGDPVGCWLDLPLEPVTPRLVANQEWLELAAPTPLSCTLRGGSSRAGFPYFTVVGLSGQLPAISYLNDSLPIEGDWLVVQSAGSSEPPFFAGFLGFLDTNGEATSTFDLSSVVLPQFLNGYRLTFCSFVWDGPWAPTGAASNAADVMLR